MEKTRIIFDDSAKEVILDVFDKKVDDEGFIVEKQNPSDRVLTKEGEEIKLEEWGGIVRGSESFVKSDIFSLVELARKLR